MTIGPRFALPRTWSLAKWRMRPTRLWLDGTQVFMAKVGESCQRQSPDLLQRAHDLVHAPHLFGFEIGFNLPAFCIALLITAILVVGIKESANFNSTIVIVKVAVVLFVIIVGIRYINVANWGHDWSTFAPMGFSGIGKAPPTFSLRTLGLTLFPLPRRKRRIRSVTFRSASSSLCWFARFFIFLSPPSSQAWCLGRNQH